MQLAAFEEIAGAMARAGVRYLVAGGLAVNAHGYLRFTKDIDIVVALDATNVHAAFEALAAIGYHPSVPVSAEQFGDEQVRRGWIEDKGMQVLNFFSDRYPATSVDVFVHEPFDFDAEYERALLGDIGPELSVRFVSIPTLIAMKEAAGRPRDDDDIKHLRWMLEDGTRDD